MCKNVYGEDISTVVGYYWLCWRYMTVRCVMMQSQSSHSHRPQSATSHRGVKSAGSATNRRSSACQHSGVISKPTEAWQVKK